MLIIHSYCEKGKRNSFDWAASKINRADKETNMIQTAFLLRNTADLVV